MKYQAMATAITRSPAMTLVTEIMILVLSSKPGSDVTGGIASKAIRKGPQFMKRGHLVPNDSVNYLIRKRNIPAVTLFNNNL